MVQIWAKMVFLENLGKYDQIGAIKMTVFQKFSKEGEKWRIVSKLHFFMNSYKMVPFIHFRFSVGRIFKHLA